MKNLNNKRIVDERIIMLINLLTNEIALTYKDAEKFSHLLDEIIELLANNLVERFLEED